MKRPITLIIMDGFGKSDSAYGNAILGNTPNLDKLMASNPYTYIGASGLSVGLPDGQMGNSEVGHTNIGAGRIVYQELTRISKEIDDGDFFKNPVLLDAVNNCKKNGSTLHLAGLVSDGGVHSHNTHLYGLLELAKQNGLNKVAVHCFMDGRDVSPTSGADFIAELEAKMREIGVGKIATIIGRYYAMDREKKWDRVEKAYNAMVYADGLQVKDAVQSMKDSYAKEVTDEFIVPTVVNGGCPVKAEDSFIFFNFRPDRAREITRAFVDPAFDGWQRKDFIKPFYVCFTQYDATMPNVEVAFKPQSMDNTFGEIVANHHMKQLRIAEYTKYAHVTFFFNAGTETVFDGEDRKLIDSPNVATYDLQPEMSAYTVTDDVVERIESGKYDAIILNFANCDMVGHTGVFEAAVKAVKTVDECVGKVVNAVVKAGGVALVTADHGNSEQMLYPDGSPFTAHTTNPVPFIVVGYPCKLRENGGVLGDIAPTMLKIMGIEQPKEMTGKSLIQ
ncbi:MAG TPA: 2,3-bisphosphoglycerate-independent phosphoglycerate mutase [Clostridiales bacterium]|nr:2,3-bisphosphoglycerate-independent phosphoglycerate mutase [Clostridiales bacterium]